MVYAHTTGPGHAIRHGLSRELQSEQSLIELGSSLQHAGIVAATRKAKTSPPGVVVPRYEFLVVV